MSDLRASNVYDIATGCGAATLVTIPQIRVFIEDDGGAPSASLVLRTRASHCACLCFGRERAAAAQSYLR